jgi:predicted urease superfamily metal-dependent hydrolase
MARFIQTGLSVTHAQNERIKALAERRGITQADVVRHLIDIALPFAEGGHGLDYARLLTILEFTSLALDTLIQKHAPEEADRLLDLAVEHAKKYHAA